jgi:hypothetical protein
VPRFVDIVTDATPARVPIPGALITVKNSDGSLATITRDDGTAYANSVITADDNGAYYFNAAIGVYTLEFRLTLSESARKVRTVALVDTAAGVTPELFGAAGDGETDDSAALAAMAAAVVAAGGGDISMSPGATYMIGGQTLNGSTPNGTYQFAPTVPYPIEIHGCTRPVRIYMNGATIKCLAGKKYGSFNSDGTVLNPTMPYTGPALSSPYFAMIYLHDNTGPVAIQDGVLDGNLANLTIGGQWGDTGWQLPAQGFVLQNNTGGQEVVNVLTHHHALDGYEINGACTSDTMPKENGVLRSVLAYCNGRQGCSFVGGKGYTFINCTFNWSGKANPGSDTAASVTSNPGAGLDLEAEGGKKVRDLYFLNCEFIGNTGVGAINDNTDCDRISFHLCTFKGTTNYVLWPKGPGFRFDRCTIVGTTVNAFGGNTISNIDACFFNECLLSNSNSLSPTGTTFTVNQLLIESVGGIQVGFRRCKLIHDQASAAAFNGSTDQVRWEDCQFIVMQSSAGFYGRFLGHRTLFLESGGTHSAVPFGSRYAPFTGLGQSGEALDAWQYQGSLNSNVLTTYDATIRRESDKRIFYGSATYDPPSLAAGAKDTIHTMTVTGVALGDKIDSLSFSVDLAGARIVAWISAANTVSYYAINENGANPLDLASGTLRVEVAQS